jgi:hypothetical protein
MKVFAAIFAFAAALAGKSHPGWTSKYSSTATIARAKADNGASHCSP